MSPYEWWTDRRLDKYGWIRYPQMMDLTVDVNIKVDDEWLLKHLNSTNVEWYVMADGRVYVRRVKE